MIGVFILTAIFVIIIYVYMRHKAKQNKASDINFVRDYHESYRRVRTHRELRSKQNDYQTYVTKYNSSEDYRERRGK